MILLDIKQYLIQKQVANLQEIAWHFKQQPEVIRVMLHHWIRKGKVEIAPKPKVCGSLCTQCEPSIAEVYHWNSESA